MRTTTLRASVAAGCVVAALGLTACGGSSTSGGGSGSGSKTIALLLPETATPRYDKKDRPAFEARVKQLCAGCSIKYANADGDPTKQQQQAEAALTAGAKVLVLDPANSASAAAIVTEAKRAKAKVVSYDRLVAGADYYVSFKPERVGQLQGQALIDKLKAEGKGSATIVMLNGDQTTDNAKQFKDGAHSAIDGSGLKVGREYDTTGWTPANAQNEMDQAITALGKNGFAGVYAANDGLASGAVAAMEKAGIDPSTRPVTGQDADLDGIQRIVAGQQYMTVYKPVKQEAGSAAQLAVALLNGRAPPAGLVNDTAAGGIPAVILTPIVVTKANVRTVVDDGFWSAGEICTQQFASACQKAGLR